MACRVCASGSEGGLAGRFGTGWVVVSVVHSTVAAFGGWSIGEGAGMSGRELFAHSRNPWGVRHLLVDHLRGSAALAPRSGRDYCWRPPARTRGVKPLPPSLNVAEAQLEQGLAIRSGRAAGLGGDAARTAWAGMARVMSRYRPMWLMGRPRSELL